MPVAPLLVALPILAPFVPDVVPPSANSEFPPEAVDERSWSGSSSKYRDEWEASNYTTLSRSNSKYDEDYNRNSSKYYGSRKERDREYGGKYSYHSSTRGEEFERDRHKRDKDKDRRDYRGKDDWKERRKDRDYYEYKDNHRPAYGKSYSKTDEYSSYSSTSSYSHSYTYGESSSSWVPPPPPKTLPEQNSPPRPPPEPPNDDDDEQNVLRNKVKPGEDPDATVDLDTRIAMLFKSKSFGSDVPSLFQLDDDSDTEATKTPVKNNEINNQVDELSVKKLKIEDELDGMEEGELSDAKLSEESSVPSPFESLSTFKSNRKFYKSRKRKRSSDKVKVDSDASDISSSEDDLLAKGSYSPPLPKTKIKDEDQMSLSSLSSTEPIKEEEIEMKMFDVHPVAFSSYNAAYYYQNSFHQFQQPNHWMDAKPFHSQYKKEATTDDPHEIAVTKVIDKLILELKQILKKDFNKRMIENTAFKKYEAWWDDQERNKNTLKNHSIKEPASSIPSAISVAPMIDSYQQSGSLGILRNLRFQRIKREPVPIAQEEDSRRSDHDDDDVVHGSDSEREDVQQASKTSYMKRTIAAPSSSESSDSSDISSDEDEEEEEKDDHAYSSDTASLASDNELMSKKTPAKKEKENNRIYSDSESDIDEIEVTKTTAKSRSKIYSDSDDEEPAPPGTSDTADVVETKENATSPEKKTSPSRQPTESDSDFFNEDVMSKPPRTPGRISSDEQVDKELPEKKPELEKKTENSNDRMYSDSEEEREYQEKIRRNTEWMEQIEREAKEENERQRLNQKVETKVADRSIPLSVPKIEVKNSNIDEQSINRNQVPPPTPGAHLKRDLFESNKLEQDTGKKKRGRPKGSTGKPKEPKKVKNGKTPLFAQPNTHPSSKLSDVEQKYSLRLSPFSSSDGGSSHASLVALEHCYSLPPSASPSLSSSPHDHQDIHMDHDYCGKSDATPLQSIQPAQLEDQHKKETITSRPVGRPRKDPNAPKAQYTKKDKNNAIEKHKSPKEKLVKIDYKQHQSMVENFVPVARYNKRTSAEEYEILCRFITQGMDQEDVDYMRRAYSYLIQNDIPGTEILHQVHWVDHCATDRSFTPSPPKKRKRDNDLPEIKQHMTGCARTEGFYKIDSKVKAHYKYHHLRGTVAGSHLDQHAKMAVAKMQNASREARSNQRRLLTAFGGATESDLLKFNQLKFRKKQLKFAKSAIHDWGLFAMEPIAADEMVIEYVGQMVRSSIADFRETKYEAIGIGSSYLFRIDHETIIDATKCGNLARFINHSCNVRFL